MGRFAFIGRRLLQVVPLMIAMTLVTFAVLQLLPVDPAQAIGGPQASPARIAELRERFGLDDPLPVRYLDFLGGLAQGDLGTSWKSQESVAGIVSARWGVTAWLIGTTLLMTVLISVPLAAVAAMRRGRAPDAAVRIATMLGLGMPAFWTGIMLVVLIAIPTGLFPVGGDFGSTPLDHLRAVTLPALALAIATSPLVIRSLRAGIIGALDSDYVTASRAIGLSGTRLFVRHVLRNAVVPTIALLGVLAGSLSFGAVILEQTFDLPGLGQTMVQASLQRDYPVVLGLTLLFGIFVVLARLLADVAIALVDPRTELS